MVPDFLHPRRLLRICGSRFLTPPWGVGGENTTEGRFGDISKRVGVSVMPKCFGRVCLRFGNTPRQIQVYITYKSLPRLPTHPISHAHGWDNLPLAEGALVLVAKPLFPNLWLSSKFLPWASLLPPFLLDRLLAPCSTDFPYAALSIVTSRPPGTPS